MRSNASFVYLTNHFAIFTTSSCNSSPGHGIQYSHAAKQQFFSVNYLNTSAGLSGDLAATDENDGKGTGELSTFVTET